ncbi:PREDICTED: uncharacterized protein LOC109192354 isoform X2 [Ipomoea nil]|uniref:uncharacterized protein LOC109192354 isoform X2 n=1 Tax=Ipomoea nil TaxID=35883 RepID=UPI000901170D|nr:PREDICTED: uncharacterized protein LOC109192354 isoform X2 [Ipomoea nil]
MKYERRSTAKKFRLQSGRSTASRSNPTPSNHSVRLAVAALFLLFSVFSTIFVSRASPSPTILRLQRFVVSPAEMKKNSIDTKIHKPHQNMNSNKDTAETKRKYRRKRDRVVDNEGTSQDL